MACSSPDRPRRGGGVQESSALCQSLEVSKIHISIHCRKCLSNDSVAFAYHSCQHSWSLLTRGIPDDGFRSSAKDRDCQPFGEPAEPKIIVPLVRLQCE